MKSQWHNRIVGHGTEAPEQLLAPSNWRLHPPAQRFPTSSDMQSYIDTNCPPAFQTYTGRDAASDTELTYGAFYPNPSGWSNGDRGVICYLAGATDQSLTKSYRKS